MAEKLPRNSMPYTECRHDVLIGHFDMHLLVSLTCSDCGKGLSEDEINALLENENRQ